MSRNKLPPVMGESLRCNDEDAYKYVATRTPFNGGVFRAQWRSNDHTPDERYVVTAWDVGNVFGRHDRKQTPNAFIPVLIWEGRNGYGLWYGVSGDNAWVCNALTCDIAMEGETVYPLTAKDMLVMQHYGIGGVSAAMAGTGISEGEDSHHLDTTMKKIMHVLDWVEDYASSGDLPNQGEPTTNHIVYLTRELLSSARREEQA